MVRSEIPFKAFVEMKKNDHGHFEVVVQGSLKLIELVNQLKKQYGVNPHQWPLQDSKNSESFIINEFIQKVKGEYKPCYSHNELCHCRMISTEKVINSIKDGSLTLQDVSRTTLAGTGCGSCHKDIEALIDQMSQFKN
jgi:bacterioferritin-associated ferredoxin